MGTRLTKSLFLLLALAAFGLLAAGCYTVLVHPTVQTTDGDNYRRTCSDCHSSADYYYWHFPYQYNWYSRYPSWSHYYHDPWWWDNYWYWKDDRGDDSPRLPERSLWQPRVAPGSQPAIAPGTGGAARDDGKASDKDSGSSGSSGENKQKQELWQPRVPPKDTDDKKSDQSGQTDKDESKQKSEDK
jgi:hypothetical protein